MCYALRVDLWLRLCDDGDDDGVDDAFDVDDADAVELILMAVLLPRKPLLTTTM